MAGDFDEYEDKTAVTPETETEVEELEPEDDADEGQDGDEENGEGSDADAEGQNVEAKGDGAQRERSPSRANARIQRQQEEVKRERELRIAAEVRAKAIEDRLAAEDARRTEQQERELFQNMTPDEQAFYRLNKQVEQTNAKLQQMESMTRDAADRAAFSAKASVNKTYARLQDTVEDKLSEIRRAGGDIAREAILKFLVGEEVIGKSGSAATKQRAEGQRKIAAAKGRPVNGRGDTAGGDREGKSLEDRLRNTFI